MQHKNLALELLKKILNDEINSMKSGKEQELDKYSFIICKICIFWIMTRILNRTFSIIDIQKNFSQVVRFYDYWGKITESKALTEAISISGIVENIKVLDIGVGTGQLFEKIIEENKSGLNYGIDLSPGMIAKAKEKFKSLPIKHLLSVGNAFFLPYKDESFNCIFSSYVLDLLPENDFEKVLGEFNRVLKVNGTGVVITMSIGDNWYNKIWYYTAKYFPSLLTNCRPIELSNFLLSAGFRIVTKEVISQNTFPSEIIKFKKVN
jgi:demethylmenaquinone methyltransferase/2-methoxy-6-polyprenyl-1,4-benzoquinol methylase